MLSQAGMDDHCSFSCSCVSGCCGGLAVFFYGLGWVLCVGTVLILNSDICDSVKVDYARSR